MRSLGRSTENPSSSILHVELGRPKEQQQTWEGEGNPVRLCPQTSQTGLLLASTCQRLTRSQASDI